MSAPSNRYLVLTREGGAPIRLELAPGRTFTIGRGEDADVRLDSPRVSRAHARIVVDEEGPHLEGVGAPGGIRLNDAPLETAAPLRGGDRVRIGDVLLEVEGAEPAARGGDPVTRERDLLAALTALLADDRAPSGTLLEGMLTSLRAAFLADRALAIRCGADPEAGVEVLAEVPEAAGGSVSLSRRFVERAASGEEPVLLSNLEAEALRAEIESLPGELRSIVAAPLLLPTGRGVLYLDSVLERRRFQARDGELLLAFARAAGTSLASAEARRRTLARGENLAELQRRRLATAELLGNSKPMVEVRREIETAASTEVSVLVTGESGCGKELVARATHRASARSDGPFVAVNCAAIPAELVESELFGHEAGAFTGASGTRRGHFELADGGTLFLDEIGDLPAGAQAKLLRALQERRIQRVGGSREIPVDFRLVCATNVDLVAAAAGKTFREDLYYRVAVFRISLPPLRARGQDAVLLAERFAEEFGTRYRRPARRLSTGARALVTGHPWPGNVRELRNAIEQAVVREEGEELSVASLEPALGTFRPLGDAGELLPTMANYPVELMDARRVFDTWFLRYHLERHAGNMTATAQEVGITRKNLYRRCKELGIDFEAFR